ncbi:uncharacterized protein RAG0_00493 [Rhynchosporium agropyri]|uniref:Uncharacterized protein n=1 Tax=Rhynchosporium agropyri TaxID=914238 RepID=A0A1E1JT45_9HELO|nr:uncharacterized protein RAG0_00493 [Rhynchosporium agropyri]
MTAWSLCGRDILTRFGIEQVGRTTDRAVACGHLMLYNGDDLGVNLTGSLLMMTAVYVVQRRSSVGESFDFRSTKQRENPLTPEFGISMNFASTV